MDFLNTGIPLGRWFGINVRLHFTFLLYAYWQVTRMPRWELGLAVIAGLYGCILLHEFGHALAARWCDGDAEDILLWPLGGLAMCRPAWHPTAHFITGAAGPFVTLVLWGVFSVLALVLEPFRQVSVAGMYGWWFVEEMAWLNRGLLLFNLLPAFPMDGGRILRDTLWHWLSAEKATTIAVWISRGIAVAAMAWAVMHEQYLLLAGAAFIFLQAAHEQHIVAAEATGTYGFSLRERLRRGHRQRAFRGGVAARQAVETRAGFHLCATCGRTEHSVPGLDFRVCTDCADGSEYCTEHLASHTHR